MNSVIENFHFLRPVWLIALVPAVVIWWKLYRAGDPRAGLTDEIAPHLLDRLVTSPTDRPKFRPITVLPAAWLIGIIALAGPSFRRMPSPFAEDSAQLILVVKMTPSMLTKDIQPSRLERVRTKIHELLESRKGTGTALITYSGSAHLVMPTTDDGSVIDHMLEALDPGIMPSEGDALPAALDLASSQLAKPDAIGSILVVADSVQESQIAAIKSWREVDKTGVQFLAALRDEVALESSGIPTAANALAASVQLFTPDETDIDSIARKANRSFVAAENRDATQWRDDGYLLIPILALGILIWSRRGWSLEAA